MRRKRFSISLLGIILGVIAAGVILGLQLFSRASGEAGWPFNIYTWTSNFHHTTRIQPREPMVDLCISLFLILAAMWLGTTISNRK